MFKDILDLDNSLRLEIQLWIGLGGFFRTRFFLHAASIGLVSLYEIYIKVSQICPPSDV